MFVAEIVIFFIKIATTLLSLASFASGLRLGKWLCLSPLVLPRMELLTCPAIERGTRTVQRCTSENRRHHTLQNGRLAERARCFTIADSSKCTRTVKVCMLVLISGTRLTVTPRSGKITGLSCRRGGQIIAATLLISTALLRRCRSSLTIIKAHRIGFPEGSHVRRQVHASLCAFEADSRSSTAMQQFQPYTNRCC